MSIADVSRHKRDPATESLVRRFCAVSHATRIHAVGNRAVSRLLEWLIQDMNTLVATRGDCRIELDGGFPFVNGVPVRASREQRAQLSEFSDLLRARMSGGLRLKGPASRMNLSAFFSGVRESASDRVLFQAWLDGHGAQAIELLPPRKLMAGSVTGSGSSVRVAASDALRGYVRAANAVQHATKNKNLEKMPAQLFRAVQDLAELAIDEPDHHLALTSVREELAGESRHPVQVCILAMALGQRLGLEKPLLVELGFAAMLVGALCSDAPEAQRLEVAGRLVTGHRLTPVRARRLMVVYEHALERPHGLHLFSRIVAIAVVYDKLTTRTEEHSPLLPDEALSQMASSTRFDPELLGVFNRVIGRYPLGSAVRLSSGELAVILHSASDPERTDRPVVRIVRDPEGRPLGRVVDLSSDPRQILGLVDPELAGLEDTFAFFR
jgi:hypothetical protein